MRVDLHVHTTASDGAWTPEEVVRGALSGALDVIAVSDHDTTIGSIRATACSQGTPLRVIPAIELSTSRQGRELHILAYFIDIQAPRLRAHEERARTLRLTRMEVMVSRLNTSGVPVRMDAVLTAAGGDSGVIGRPHLAEALVSAGHAASIADAFDRYIGDALPAFVPTALMDPAEGVELAVAAGGLPVWAHPPGDLVDGLLPELVRAGLRGLETYRPQSLAQHVRRLEGVASSAGQLKTRGSDWQ
jgi:predicted metal-dependent phosphoesterase TrpH